ncbi:uncharacterized protein LOC101846496 [Aplysia californica]|uniref:Uncharacterized protein LOC101846496 n=1 Tax=Aplysia californica TaxID=6500 RepID=A0ABM1VR37_APLCA|nr:uncharacterized protein LOC101846496 [Aplysia californica]
MSFTSLYRSFSECEEAEVCRPTWYCRSPPPTRCLPYRIREWTPATNYFSGEETDAYYDCCFDRYGDDHVIRINEDIDEEIDEGVIGDDDEEEDNDEEYCLVGCRPKEEDDDDDDDDDDDNPKNMGDEKQHYTGTETHVDSAKLNDSVGASENDELSHKDNAVRISGRGLRNNLNQLSTFGNVNRTERGSESAEINVISNSPGPTYQEAGKVTMSFRPCGSQCSVSYKDRKSSTSSSPPPSPQEHHHHHHHYYHNWDHFGSQVEQTSPKYSRKERSSKSKKHESKFESKSPSQFQFWENLSPSPSPTLPSSSSSRGKGRKFKVEQEDLENLTPEELKRRSRERLCEYVYRDTVGANSTFFGPWGKNTVTYLDYVASGRPLKCIESYIRENVMPTYANTHTEVSFNAQQTTLFREEARAIIKEAVNATEDDAVIFTGSGATSAVNKLLHALKPKKPLVLIGPYEHHSNILPWLNVPGAKVVRIRQTQDGLLDLDHLTWELKKGSKRQIIGSFSAASNVTGILTDVNAVSALVHKYKGIVLFDYACAGPYVDINMNPKGKGEQAGLVYKDAVFISPHKFVGGPGTPGILIAKRNLFRNEEPHNVGGGTVVFVRRKAHRYISDPEHREEGGTPAILESIRAGLVFKLKQTFTSSFIMAKEEDMLRKAKMAWSRVPNLIILGNMNAARLPIFPLLIYNKATGRLLHHDFVAMVMNDVFGLQVRSGCACAAPYGLDLMGMSEDQALRFERLVVTPKGEGGKEEMDKEPDTSTGCYDNIVFKPGFVRLNLPYFLSEATFNFVIQAVQMVADHAWSLLPLYDFDKKTGKWWFIQQEKLKPKKHLKDVSFLSGQLEVDGELGEGESVPTFHRGRGGYKGHDLSDDSRGSQDSLDSGGYDDSFEEVEASSYAEILKRAKKIFHDAEKNVPSYGSEHKSILHHDMRWFMLPEEAAGVISGDPVIHLPPDDLPFFPGALARRLGLSVVDHKARASMDKDFPVEY